MQIEIYDMTAEIGGISVNLVAICDSFSSFLWDIEYYSCGSFEIYIAATPQNLSIFRTGRIIGRSDDKQHYGIIEKIQLNADTENGDYLTISGRFLMCLLERRIIYPALVSISERTYATIVREAVSTNCMMRGEGLVRMIPGLKLGEISGKCWENTTHLQISYVNLMEWIYTICETIGGTANIRLQSEENGGFSLIFDLSEGTDRSVLQNENPHIIFSDLYNNLLSFEYTLDYSKHCNFAYIHGSGEGAERKRTIFYNGDKIPQFLERYEISVDARDLSSEVQINGETTEIPINEYIAILKQRGAEKLVPVTEKSESTIAVNSQQYQYNKDYFLGDYVTVEHQRFGLIQPKIQLVGMIESFDKNGHSLTPTFKGA
ncbi:MAG: siphovirus ReqiPepy6 Gp37-like family protein [Ruminococcus sp.]|nr:siphovirus ReqiPepy6 Gp37-like family protein [Ruminococcus sp.]